MKLLISTVLLLTAALQGQCPQQYFPNFQGTVSTPLISSRSNVLQVGGYSNLIVNLRFDPHESPPGFWSADIAGRYWVFVDLDVTTNSRGYFCSPLIFGSVDLDVLTPSSFPVRCIQPQNALSIPTFNPVSFVIPMNPTDSYSCSFYVDLNSSLFFSYDIVNWRIPPSVMGTVAFQTHVIGNISHSHNGGGWFWLTEQLVEVL